MSSSSLISIVYAEEVDGYGVTPPDLAAVTLKTARKTTENLSGTPQTTESQETREDRMSSGQVVTGLDVGGPINFELAPDTFFKDWFEAVMLERYVPTETVNTTVTLTPDPTDNQKATLTLLDPFANLIPGVICHFQPAAADRPVVVQITSVDTPSTVFTVATSRGEAAVTGEVLDVRIPMYADIGRTKISFLVGKSYEDQIKLGTNDEVDSQTYQGELLSGFSLNADAGEIITGTFETLGNSYVQEPADSFKQQVIDAGGTVVAAGTSNQLNGAVDVPLVTVDDVATDFCIETLSLTFDNGLSPKNCLGKQAPIDYELGTATISIEVMPYNSAESYAALMPKKVDQTPVSFTYVLQNLDGGYAFHIEAAQLSFDDPSGNGQNQPVMIEASGVGKVGANGESALRIYIL